MKELTTFILVLFAVEAVTEIIGESDLFAPLRSLLKPVPWLGRLLDCRYCISVWAGLVGGLAFHFREIPAVWIVTAGFSLHRMANVLHEVLYRWLERMPILWRKSLDPPQDSQEEKNE